MNKLEQMRKRVGSRSLQIVGAIVAAMIVSVIAGVIHRDVAGSMVAILAGVAAITSVVSRAESRTRAHQLLRSIAKLEKSAGRVAKEAAEASAVVRGLQAVPGSWSERQLSETMAVTSTRFAWIAEQLDRVSRSESAGCGERESDEESVQQGRPVDRPLGEAASEPSSRRASIASGGAHSEVERSNSSRRLLAADAMAVAALYAPDREMINMPLSEGWSLDVLGLCAVLSFSSRVPDGATVVELGSGVSTVWVARLCASQGNRFKFVSIEHSPEYFEKTRRLLADAGYESDVDLRLSRLSEQVVEGRTFDWYSDWSDLQDVGCLLVDGPPGATGPIARFPAFSLLSDRMLDGGYVCLDDADREDEQEVVREWRDRLLERSVRLRDVARYGRLRVMEKSRLNGNAESQKGAQA